MSDLFLQVLGLFLGLILLVKGADVFVDASSGLARWFKIPSIIIGLTVVALGTSIPEIVVSVSAALSGTSDMAIGNVIGSNTFNILLIMGVCAFVMPLSIDIKKILKDFSISMVAATILLFMKLYFIDVIPRSASFVLLALFCVYIFIFIKNALRDKNKPNHSIEKEGDEKQKTPIFNIMIIVIGVSVIVFGGQLTVSNAVSMAESFGVSERVIGLTILAIGTSLPELVTSIVACKKGQVDLALGNIIGSSIFNILLILGLTGVILPLNIDRSIIFDILFLLFASVVFLLFSYTGKKLVRAEGFLMVALYVLYMIVITIF